MTDASLCSMGVILAQFTQGVFPAMQSHMADAIQSLCSDMFRGVKEYAVRDGMHRHACTWLEMTLSDCSQDPDMV